MALSPEQRDDAKFEALKAKYGPLPPEVVELGRRFAARDSFSAYRGFVFEDYAEWGYVGLVNDALQRVFDGDCRRLMVFMGPQHGKTQAVSMDFSSYWVGRRPKEHVIGTAYNYDRAMDYGRAVRARVRSDEFRRVFPGVDLDRDSQAADRWNTIQGGGYYAAGVGTALTGRKGDLMIIDDPFSGPEDAGSEVQRERVWRWYNTVFRTRLAPGGAIILVMTRWHDDDLAGRFLGRGEENRGAQGLERLGVDSRAVGAHGRRRYVRRGSRKSHRSVSPAIRTARTARSVRQRCCAEPS